MKKDLLEIRKEIRKGRKSKEDFQESNWKRKGKKIKKREGTVLRREDKSNKKRARIKRKKKEKEI